MKRTRVKVCGITSIEDANFAADIGVDAIGLVFYSKSPRYVDPLTASKIAVAVGPFVAVVALFVNESADQVKRIINLVHPDVIQFHGDEDEAYCNQFSRPYIKALRMHDNIDINKSVSSYPSALGFLFDSWSKDKYGGTGDIFDWGRLIELKGQQIILAGGLNPDNIKDAISTIKPYALDVSGGVEISPGVKSNELMQLFVDRCTMN